MKLPRVSAPVHGIDFSQMPPQRPSSAHLNSANGVDVSCDLSKKRNVGCYNTAVANSVRITGAHLLRVIKTIHENTLTGFKSLT